MFYLLVIAYLEIQESYADKFFTFTWCLPDSTFSIPVEKCKILSNYLRIYFLKFIFLSYYDVCRPSHLRFKRWRSLASTTSGKAYRISFKVSYRNSPGSIEGSSGKDDLSRDDQRLNSHRSTSAAL